MLNQRYVRRQDVDSAVLVRMYTKDHFTLRQIAAKVGMTAPGVLGRLKRQGITSRDGEWVTQACAFCGVSFRRTRSQSKHRRTYCSAEHYYAALAGDPGSPYQENRNGGRLARAIVAQHFALEKQYVVHHEDRDQTHNDLANLRVFATQSDHMAYHRGRAILPIWDGRSAGRGA